MKINWRNQHAGIGIIGRTSNWIKRKVSNIKFWIVEKVKAFIRLVILVLKWTSIGGVIGGMFYLTFLAGRISSPEYVKAEVMQSVTRDNLPAKIEELKERLANIVKKGESEDKKMKQGEIWSVFDPSDAMRAKCLAVYTVRPIDCESYGLYQEKVGTIMYFAPKVYKKEVSQMEAMAIANDEARAKDFFLTCSIEIEGCVWNWTVAKKHQAEVQLLVDVIRTLEK